MQAIIDNILVQNVTSEPQSGVAYGNVISVGEQVVYIKPGHKIYFLLHDFYNIEKYPEKFYAIKEDAVLAIDNK